VPEKLILNPPHLGPDKKKKTFQEKWIVSFCYCRGGDSTIAILPTPVLLPFCFTPLFYIATIG
jgi:hypothetical protein